jgi:ribosomal protein S21
MKKRANIIVYVNGNIERGLRQLKKKSEREQITRDMKRRVYHEPKTQKRRKRLVRAIKHNMMLLIANGTVSHQ